MIRKSIIEIEFIRAAGLCLLIGSILATMSMVLHPSGGNIEHIAKISNVLIFSHSIALFCLPFVGYGFLGLSKLLQTKNRVSTLAFMICSFGLIAGMIAATINGLTLPGFASSFALDERKVEITKSIIRYGHCINTTMALILIFAISMAVGIWSVLIIQTAKLPRWLGYFGLIIVIRGLVCVFLKFNFTDLYGFRIFVAGLVAWIIFVGINLVRSK